mmetsp:Transcript_97481/g.135489  ORF Transcript_97481/g.135489 Transcript_97481/m.135489 type:complete len:146 (-) Transcript_97481:34-471(-)
MKPKIARPKKINFYQPKISQGVIDDMFAKRHVKSREKNERVEKIKRMKEKAREIMDENAEKYAPDPDASMKNELLKANAKKEDREKTYFDKKKEADDYLKRRWLKREADGEKHPPPKKNQSEKTLHSNDQRKSISERTDLLNDVS